MTSTTNTYPLYDFPNQETPESFLVDQSAIEESQSPQHAFELRPITRQRQIITLISSFLTVCINVGLNKPYRVFQSYYVSATQIMLPKTTGNEGSLIAFVGTLGSGLTWVGSIVVNPLMTSLGQRIRDILASWELRV